MTIDFDFYSLKIQEGGSDSTFSTLTLIKLSSFKICIFAILDFRNTFLSRNSFHCYERAGPLSSALLIYQPISINIGGVLEKLRMSE